MRTHSVLLLPGDGIGPEVVGEAKRVMQVVASLHDFAIDFSTADLGRVAIEPKTLRLRLLWLWGIR